MSIGTIDASFDDWTGKQNDAGLMVLRLVAKRPAVKWAVKCARCGTEFNLPHSKVKYASCPSSICGQPLRKPSRLERERASAHERQRIEEENAARLAELRMAEETEGYELPSRVRPVPGNTAPMSERERIEMRQRREELEAVERAEREEREAPIRAAEAELHETHRRIAAVQRDTLLNPKIQDPELFVSEETFGFSLTPEGAAEWNGWHFKQFCEKQPGFYPSDSNISIMGDYWHRHGVQLVTEEMLSRLYQRMRDAGVPFEQKPEEPEQKPQRTAAPVPYDQRPQANLTIAPSQKPQPVLYPGWDEDGNPRQYTEREVSRWSSEEMKRRLRLTAASGALDLPTVGPGPRGTRY